MSKKVIIIIVITLSLLVGFGFAFREIFFRHQMSQEKKVEQLFELSGDADTNQLRDDAVYSQEVASLKKRLPISEKLFVIGYDYSQDKFLVQLDEPKLEASIAFDAWLTGQSIYLIPKEKFIFE